MRRNLLLVLAVAGPLSAQSATGSLQPETRFVKEFGTMWTFDAPPFAYWKSRYDFAPDKAWLHHGRRAALRTPGCSASFVAANGLVMTNHHCGRDCTAGSATADSNYIQTGFAA